MFVVAVPEDQIELASDRLWQLGVRAIEERPTSDGGAVELWTAVGDEPDAIERAIESLGDRFSHRIVDAEIDAAGSTWRDFVEPVWVTEGLVVVPAWQQVDVDDGVLAVPIDPGSAFGLGDHPTTLLSLRALARLVVGDADVLDVGCGTGVIAVTAACLQDRPVRAIDIAAAAVEASRDNAKRNGVGERVVVDGAPLSEVDSTFDIVVANILAPTLIELADDLRRVTRPTGRLVISGILADAHSHVIEALHPMAVEQTDVLDGWACVVLRQ